MTWLDLQYVTLIYGHINTFYDLIDFLGLKAEPVVVCERLNNDFIGLWLIWYDVCIVLCSRLREQTHSLWAFLMSEKQNYLNPFYSPAFAELHPVLEPSTLPYHFKSVPPSSLSCRYFKTVLINCLCIPVILKVLEEHVPPVWSVHASTSVHPQNHSDPEREQPQSREHIASTGECEFRRCLILVVANTI